jgi:hypothetical protein
LPTIFPAHAPKDAPFARDLSAFLESGCDVVCLTAEAAIKPGEDLLAAAEMGHSADILVVLLSPASNLRGWQRDRWEPLLQPDPATTGTQVAVFLLEECVFPPLLRRGSKFFDGTTNRISAMRRLKRWIKGLRHGALPAMVLSPDLEELYCALSDQPGILTAPGPVAERFAREAVHDFEAVFRIPSHGRTLAQIAGELGAQLGMALDGPVEDNCRRIGAVLSGKRCLVVLDAPQVAVDALLPRGGPAGRTSVLFTAEPVDTAPEAATLAAARRLVAARRYAEAYELLYLLLNSGAEPEPCARELIWICEHWDRLEEANNLRFRLGPAPSEQLRLF